MTTARQIITRAMQKVGILMKNEDPSADEIQDGLSALNAMLSSWSNDSMNIFVRVTESFPLVGGTASYTIGPSQTFNTVRPMLIVEAHIRDASNFDYVLSVIPDEVYQDIMDKTFQGMPQFINYTNGYPYGTLNVYLVPNVNYTLYLTSEKELTQFATVQDNVTLPPGWEDALVFNLAMRLAPEYGQEAPASVAQIAGETKAAIQRSVAKNRTFDAQPAIGNIDNIYSGWVRGGSY